MSLVRKSTGSLFVLILYLPTYSESRISLHKRNFRLDTGDCLNDDEYKVLAFEVKEDESGSGDLLVKLPPPDELDALIGSSKWMGR